jgi:hypothetical protein
MPLRSLFFATLVTMVGFYRPIRVWSAGILCGRHLLPQLSCGTGTQAVVSGRRNRSNFSKRSNRSIPKASHNDQGSVF